MKTRDLMRGDKVYETLLDDTPQVVTVEEVGQNHIYIGMEDDDMALLRYEPEHLEWNIKHIEPIPLTEEILTMNGWKDSDTNLFNGLNYVFIYGENGTLTLNHWTNRDKNEEYYTFAIGGGDRVLKYVHELQQALRVCGLNEFADNFKIE